MKLYSELAGWFHLLTAPPDYAEEAEVYGDLIASRAQGAVTEVLELGSGGGNNASHMKRRFSLTLSDLSEEMLAVSGEINPECEHLRGDMRSLRLGRTFDAVFVHDAVMYLATERDLRATMATAAEHCRPGGVALFSPDCVRETFREYEHEGGHDGEDGRSLRYHERVRDPDPDDSWYRVDFVIRLREKDGSERLEKESHRFGVFGRGDWVAWLGEAGFEVEAIPVELGEDDSSGSFVFLGVRRESAGRRGGGASPRYAVKVPGGSSCTPGSRGGSLTSWQPWVPWR